MYADVLIEYSAKAIDQTFTYIVPDSLKSDIKVGMKVLVPFGNKIINGFVTNLKNTTDSKYELKEIKDIIDKYFCLNKELMELGKYLQEKTLCTKISAYQTMLPSSLKVKEQKSNYSKYLVYIELNKDIDEIDEFINNNKRSKKQIEILNILKEGKVLKSSIESASSIKSLLDKELIKETKEQIYRLNNHKVIETNIEFSDDQQNALDTIDLNSENTYLLHGITGSGKTEVYLELIKRVVKMGKKAILLVPEISLTAQIVNKFYDRFGDDVAIFHSGLSSGEKYDEYLKILREEVHIVIGTRSAIFTPMTNLGIIIIDEEHSDTYKQDTTPRYHAADMADFRKKYNHIPLVLGSATPSLETMARALKGVYTYIPMNHRIGSSTLPTIDIVDMTKELKKRNMIFSEKLKNKIQDRILKKEQVILLLNRRGYSTVISCKSCGFTYKCPHCDITLTYHKTTNKLQCHYCGYTVFKSDTCPKCKEKAISTYGLGTEQVESFIKTQFPSARVVRMDIDTTSRKGSTDSIIKGIENHDYDIIIGTQMISKGLDFPNVILVGVINADESLNIPDFRSGETTFSLISQVSGRAGRGVSHGSVILQTYNPDCETLAFVKNNDYIGNFNNEMKIRKILKYPPYYFITSVKVKSKNYDLFKTEVNKIATFIRNNIEDTSICLGPTTCPVFKINNVYRFQIIIKYKKDKLLEDTLRRLDEEYALNKDISLEIDVDPIRI